jgi:hypothetical protein
MLALGLDNRGEGVRNLSELLFLCLRERLFHRLSAAKKNFLVQAPGISRAGAKMQP